MVSFFGTKRKKSNATMADSTSKRRKVKAVKKTPGGMFVLELYILGSLIASGSLKP